MGVVYSIIMALIISLGTFVTKLQKGETFDERELKDFARVADMSVADVKKLYENRMGLSQPAEEPPTRKKGTGMGQDDERPVMTTKEMIAQALAELKGLGA